MTDPVEEIQADEPDDIEPRPVRRRVKRVVKESQIEDVGTDALEVSREPDEVGRFSFSRLSDDPTSVAIVACVLVALAMSIAIFLAAA